MDSPIEGMLKLMRGMKRDPAFMVRWLDGEIDSDGQPIPRSPYQVAQVKQAKLRTAQPAYIALPSVELSGSYVGGQPSLSKGFIWPSWHGRELSFLAQVDLAEVPQDERFSWLPTSGRLLFFVGEDDTCGYTPLAGKVIYLDNDSSVEMLGQGQVERQFIRFIPYTTYEPLGAQDELRQYQDNREIMLWYENLVPLHYPAPWQIGGWPRRPEATEMREECERRHRGLDADDLESQKLPCFQQAIGSWHLIGQFNLADLVSLPSGMTRGFFWVKVEDERADFDRAMLVGRWD